MNVVQRQKISGALAMAVFIGGVVAIAQTAPDKARFDEILERVEQERKELGERYRRAKSRAARAAVLGEARQYIVRAITEEIVPAWKGTPWTMAIIRDGLKPNATWPGETGRGISCSWFVVRVLQNAGLRFLGPSQFAGTISVHFQRSTVANPKQLRRFYRVDSKGLKKKMVALGDGLYVVGLNCHIGFIHVRGDEVDFIHSSYVEPYQVEIEPLTESPAIAFSEDAGYVVSPLFHDAYLLDFWLSGRKLPFKKPKK